MYNNTIRKTKNKKSPTNFSQEEFTTKEINDLNDEEIRENHKINLTEKFCMVLQNLFFKIMKTILIIFKVYGIYLLWICLHYFSAHLYVKFCVPNSFVGFFMSPFMVATPHCQGLRWIVYNAAHIINNMWILIGVWIYSMIWIINTETRVET